MVELPTKKGTMEKIENKKLRTVKAGSKLKIAIIVVFLLSAVYTYIIGNPDTNAKICINPEILKHVYNPGRLSVLSPCKTVWGTVVNVVDEGDGDAQIMLRVDPYFSDTVNSVNVEKLGGNMVVGIVCAFGSTQKDAADACSGYKNKIDVPKINDHIIITGQFVSDNEHGGWNEIHPVYAICHTNTPVAAKHLIGGPTYSSPCIKLV